MANLEYVEILNQGVETWNKWRQENSKMQIDLTGVNLKGARLRKIDLYRTDLRGANLEGAHLSRADFYGSNLSETNLQSANLRRVKFEKANLYRANLSNANLRKADLLQANLCEARLCGADLQLAQLVETNLEQADLTGCKVYGISAWNLKLNDATQQKELVITESNQPLITVDNLEVAQFVYLLLNNEKIRNVIDTIGRKGVLILGRFTPERKIVLDAIREKLRELNYTPIMFDFDCPTDRDFTETIMTLAGMCRFIIADITNPKSSPLELQATVPHYMIPFVPIIQEGERPFAMFKDLHGKFDWVMDPLKYDTASNLVAKLEKAVIDPALERHRELMVKKAEALPIRSINDY